MSMVLTPCLVTYIVSRLIVASSLVVASRGELRGDLFYISHATRTSASYNVLVSGERAAG